MFKIGNSKELPTIPDHLSEDGKDFVRLCLQRNPQNRPSAAQLLEHSFVKNAMLERSILTAVPSEDPTAIINAVRSLVCHFIQSSFVKLHCFSQFVHGYVVHEFSRFVTLNFF